MQANIRFNNPSNAPETDVKHYLPVLLLASALVIWFGFQLMQTLRTRDGLINAFNNQETQFQTAKKMEASLSALATGTKELANLGNPNAAQIVKALTQRGINISDPKVPAMQPAKEGQPLQPQK